MLHILWFHLLKWEHLLLFIHVRLNLFGFCGFGQTKDITLGSGKTFLNYESVN